MRNSQEVPSSEAQKWREFVGDPLYWNGKWRATDNALDRMVRAPSTFAAWVLRDALRELQERREKDAYRNYCGCCGHEIPDEGTDDEPMWCHACIRHLGVVGASWDRTFEAVRGEPCPFQVGVDAG